MSKEWEALAAQIRDLQRQLAEVIVERDQYKAACDQYKAACELADALRNQQFVPGTATVRPHKAGPFVLFERAPMYVAESPPCAHFAGQK